MHSEKKREMGNEGMKYLMHFAINRLLSNSWE